MPILSQESTHDLTVHVHAKNAFTIQFLQLFGIAEAQLIAGSVHATELLLPESISCGNTPAYLLHELRSAIFRTILIQDPDEGHRDKCSIVVVKRASRRILNHPALVAAMQSSFRQCHVKEHRGHETVREQLEMVSSASAIVAPHGAGLANIIACRRGTLVFEFLNGKKDTHIMYMVMALKLGLRYIGLPVVGSGAKNTDKTVDIPHTVTQMQAYLDVEMQ